MGKPSPRAGDGEQCYQSDNYDGYRYPKAPARWRPGCRGRWSGVHDNAFFGNCRKFLTNKKSATMPAVQPASQASKPKTSLKARTTASRPIAWPRSAPPSAPRSVWSLTKEATAALPPARRALTCGLPATSWAARSALCTCTRSIW